MTSMYQESDTAGPMTTTTPTTVATPSSTASRVGAHDGGYDVVIVGGGAAGLSAATALGRARRSVLVVDGGEPRNAPAAGVHNFLSRDGIPPAELLRIGRAEAESYGARILAASALTASRGGAGFLVGTDAGTTVEGRRLLIATGLADGLPAIPGLRERWGADVLHCPYCHGWEVRDRSIGILGTGPFAVHQALLFRQWSARITLFLHTAPRPDEAEWEQLAARGIGVVEGEVESLRISDDALRGVTMAGGRFHPVEALVVAPAFTARAELFTGLGLEAVPYPLGSGTHIESGPGGSTSVPGLWVAGNVTDPTAQVVTSAAAGLLSGAAINSDLMAEELQAALTEYRAPFSAASEARNTERILGTRRHGLD